MAPLVFFFFADKIFMNRTAIAKIGRENHLNHLTRILPLIVAVFAVQCYVISQMNPETSIGNYALYLAFVLSALIGSLVYYDTQHQVLLFEDHLEIQLGQLGTKKIIYYHEIEKIITTEEEISFSSMLLYLPDNKKQILYFVDNPLLIKSLIEELKKASQMDLAA